MSNLLRGGGIGPLAQAVGELDRRKQKRSA